MMLEFFHALPPCPTDAVMSKIKSSQGPIVAGEDIQTTGSVGFKGANRGTVVFGKDARLEQGTADERGHAAWTDCARSITGSPTLILNSPYSMVPTTVMLSRDQMQSALSPIKSKISPHGNENWLDCPFDRAPWEVTAELNRNIIWLRSDEKRADKN